MIRLLQNTCYDRSVRQLIRYGLVGLASNSAMYFAYLIISYLGGAPKLAMTCVYLFGAYLGFVANRKWTFSHRGSPVNVALRYFFAHSIGYILNLALLYFFVDQLGYAHQWVQAAAIVIVAGFLFFVFKLYVFRNENIVTNRNI